MDGWREAQLSGSGPTRLHQWRLEPAWGQWAAQHSPSLEAPDLQNCVTVDCHFRKFLGMGLRFYVCLAYVASVCFVYHVDVIKT